MIKEIKKIGFSHFIRFCISDFLLCRCYAILILSRFWLGYEESRNITVQLYSLERIP